MLMKNRVATVGALAMTGVAILAGPAFATFYGNTTPTETSRAVPVVA